MKRIKKLAALMMAAIMALAMSMTAFAADVTTSTQPAKKSETYKLYQIFTGKYQSEDNKEGLIDARWGANSTGKEGELVDGDILKALQDLADKSEVERLDVIKQYANLNSTPIEGQPVASEDGKLTYSNLEAGYYLISGTVTYEGGEEADTLYVVQVTNGTLVFTPKVDVPTVDKKIVEGENKVEGNNASIGDTVNYEIVGTMPSRIADYKTYTYLFTDTLSKGLSYDKDSIRVAVNDKDVTKYFWKSIETTENGTTIIRVGIQDIKAFALTEVGAITPDTKVVLTYSATLNNDAVIGSEGNPNKVVLNYSNDPNNSGTGTTEPPKETPDEPIPPSGVTPEKEVKTFTTELTITKTNTDGKFLPGTEFTLSGGSANIVLISKEVFVEDENGEYWLLKDKTYTKEAPITEGDKANADSYESTTQKYKKTTTFEAKKETEDVKIVGVVNADGTVTFRGLGAGKNYKLEETKALAGYNKIDPITFDIKFEYDSASKTGKFTTENVVGGSITSNNNVLSTTIINQSGSLLPSTGGIGTTIFYIVGAILVIGAGVILVTKKRMSKEV